MSIVYSSLKGKCFRMMEAYPIYNDEEIEVGRTAPGDVAVVTEECLSDPSKFVELTVASGKFAGYMGLVLYPTDIWKCQYIGIEDSDDIRVREDYLLREPMKD